MTYCLGMLVADGLVMMADTRTNAGVDNISTFRKLQRFGDDASRLIVVASAGSLSTTQAAVQLVTDGVDDGTGHPASFADVTSIWEAARIVGLALRRTREAMQPVADDGIRVAATLLVGGSIGGERTRLFLVYDAGNAIECGPDTPFLQIGETKYGKPILDRALAYATPLEEAVKLGLLSFNAAMRSNLAVGLPIDVIAARQGESRALVRYRVEVDDPYWAVLDGRWADAMQSAVAAMPDAPFMDGDG